MRGDWKLLKISFLEVGKALCRKVMESLILGKKFLTMCGECRRISILSTTDLWLLNIPGMVVFCLVSL
jgi:hypothetical protein